MRPLYIIAHNTFMEVIRDRILYGLVVFAVLIIGLSLALGELSFAEQARISIDFGLAAIQISSVAISIFLGCTLVSREIDKKTILTLLVRPVSRTQFLVGKAMGLICVNLVVIIALALILAVVFSSFGVRLNLIYLTALVGILLEATILLSLTIFFATFTSPTVVVILMSSVYIIGHWIETLQFFVQKNQGSFLSMLGVGVGHVFPDLEKLNWRAFVVYGESVPSDDVFMSTIYALVWSAFAVSLASIIFRRRDFG